VFGWEWRNKTSVAILYVCDDDSSPTLANGMFGTSDYRTVNRQLASSMTGRFITVNHGVMIGSGYCAIMAWTCIKYTVARAIKLKLGRRWFADKSSSIHIVRYTFWNQSRIRDRAAFVFDFKSWVNAVLWQWEFLRKNEGTNRCQLCYLLIPFWGGYSLPI